MNPLLRHAVFVAGVVLAFGSVLMCGPACTPADRAAVAQTAPSAIEGACVLLHALAKSGAADSVCATAEDLAPFVGVVLATRAADAPSTSARRAPRPSVPRRQIAELPAPRTTATRTCVLWREELASDAGP